MQRAWRRWNAYWRAPGGRLATALLRIAIAVSLLWMLRRYAGPPATSAYHFKHGLWMLYPGIPALGLRHALVQVGAVATIAMLVGLWSRAAHAVSLVACMAVAAYGVSDLATWSHTDVPPLLASLAFLGARGGDALAVDAWWARRRGRVLPSPHQLHVRLVQVAVAGVFASAAVSKLAAGGWSLDWALSDSLRHHLLARFDWVNVPRTPLASWLLVSSTRYETAALLNLVSQLAPLATLVLLRHPILRALAGSCFVAEVLGLGYVMDLWNPHWLPLAAVFVDWDALARSLPRVRRPDAGAAPPPPAPPVVHAALAPPVAHAAPASPGPPAAPRVWWPTLYIAFFALNAIWLNQRLNAFPFSGFPMFAQVRAARPYSRHLPYDMAGSHIEVICSRPLNPVEQSWMDASGRYRWFWQIRDRARLEAAMTGLLGDARLTFPTLAVTGVRLLYSRFRAPAYPAPARLDRTDLAVMAEATDAGVVTQLGAPLATTMYVLPDLGSEIIPITATVVTRGSTILSTAPPGPLPWLVR